MTNEFAQAAPTNYSILWKAPGIGAIAGSFVTILIMFLAIFAQGENLFSWLIMWAYYWSLWTPRKLCESFGWNWPLDTGEWSSGSVLGVKSMLFGVITNSMASAVVGLMIGAMLYLSPSRSKCR
jgi:hypothetical protein